MMCLLPACLIICCIVLSSHCYQFNKSLCEGSACFYLYESHNNYLTWDDNYDACNKVGQEMVRIESKQMQTVVDKLLQALPQNIDRKVWIGGRRSTDTTWRFMNGTVFNTGNMPTSRIGQYCLYVRLCKGFNTEYYFDSCDEKTGPSRLLCQYDSNEPNYCRSSDIHSGNKCYTGTPFGGNGIRIDWYTGQTYCSQSDIQGDIAYSYLDNDTLINNIIGLVHPGYNCAQLWLGVRSRIWSWKTASSRDEYTNTINYFNWQNVTKVDSSDDNCIYIDVDKTNNWLVGHCTNSPLKYYICMKSNGNTKETATTNANTREVTTGATSPTSTLKSTPSVLISVDQTQTVKGTVGTGGNTGKSFQISGYIIAIVVVLLVLVVIIGLVVFFVLRKRKKPVDKDEFVNEHFHNPSARHSDVEEPRYDDVKLSGDHDDVINHYGIVRAENPKKAEVRYKEAPSGELYAISSKQINKMDVNKSKEDGNLEVVYAKLKKKKNQKPKSSKNSGDSGTAKLGNDVVTETPSIGEANNGSKHTEHFEAPSGEVYARVIKNGKDF